MRQVALHILQRATTSPDAALYRPEERDWLLSMLHREDFLRGPWPLADLIKIAATGDAQAADFALETLKTNGLNGGDRGLAWTLACSAFADNNRFKTWVATQLSAPDEHALILYDVSAIPQQWRDDPEFAQALRPYLERELRGVTPHHAAGLATALPPDQAQAALLRGLDTTRPYAAARTLAERYGDDEQVRNALAGRLHGDFSQAAPMAGIAVDILGPQEGFAVLVSLLRQSTADHSSEEHVVVAEALAEAWKEFEQASARQDAEGEAARKVLARYDPAELAALCTAVDPHPLAWHVPAVISAWPGQPAVQEFADKLIHDTRPIMSGIADAIPVAVLRAYGNRTDAPSLRILDKTLNLLKHIDPELREVLTFELARSPLSATELIDVMAGWKKDPDSAIRRTALIGLTQVIMRHQQARNDLAGSATLTADMEWLRAEIRDDLCAYGPELKERRQLAWIGMLMLGDPTLIDGIRESIGVPNEPGVTLDAPYGDDADRILVDLVAANWAPLRAHFGDKLFARLSGRASARQGTERERRSHVLLALATVASRYPAIAEILRKESDDDAALRHDKRFLLWVREENRGEQGVLRAFVTSLGRTQRFFPQNQILDALLDRDSWNVSDELFKAILTEETAGTPPSPVHRADVLAVYTQLFPSDDLSVAALRDLETWFATDSETREQREWSDSLAIAFGAALPQDLPALAARAHSRFRSGGLHRYLPMFTRPLMRRLRVDEGAVEAFKDALNNPMGIRENSPIMAASWDPIADAHPELQPLQRRYLFAVVLRVAGALPQADAVEAIRVLESASPDTVVHNPLTNFEGPLRLAVLDLAAAR
ncbi:hypothetical protein ACWCQQ_48025 [Streptomyces sp. NPDC002143]